MQESFREHESSRKLKRVKVKRAQKRTRGEGTGVFRELLLEPKHSLCLLIKTAPDG